MMFLGCWLVQQRTNDLIALKEDIDTLANSELSQQAVTPDLTNQINNIKQQAAELLAKGGHRSFWSNASCFKLTSLAILHT